MTCIIGLVHGGSVYIGGDSAAVAGWVDTRTTLPKVFRTGEFLIGFTTSFRMGQLLQYQLRVPEQDKTIGKVEFIITVFVPAVMAVLKDHAFATIENNTETGGQFLVGYKGSLFEVGSGFGVTVPPAGMGAVGCGEEFAIGAMAASEGLPPKQRIKNALKIVARYSGGVSGPFCIEELKG